MRLLIEMAKTSTDNSILETTTDKEEDLDANDSMNSSDYLDYEEYEREITEHVQWSITTVSTLLGILSVLVLYKGISEKRRNKTYDSLNLKHVMFSLLHAFLVQLQVYKKDRRIRYNSLSTELMCLMEISIPTWTACVSLKMFTDLYLFMGRAEVYSAKDFTVFGCGSIATFHVYELFFITLGVLMDQAQSFSSATRLTCVLLTVSLPVAVACVIIKSLCFKSSDIVKSMGLFLLLHLIVFILCDVSLVLYIIAEATSQDESVMDMATSLLYYRISMEVMWFVGSHYLGKILRIYSEN